MPQTSWLKRGDRERGIDLQNPCSQTDALIDIQLIYLLKNWKQNLPNLISMSYLYFQAKKLSELDFIQNAHKGHQVQLINIMIDQDLIAHLSQVRIQDCKLQNQRYSCMSSTYRQRFVGEPRENDIKFKRTGDIRLLSICLGYAGTQSPLSCIQDGKRIEELAKIRKITDFVKLYDDKSTPGYPSFKNVELQLASMCQRCKPGDIMLVYYSGHGTQVPNEDGTEESGMDQALCLRNQNGEDQTMIDDDLAEIITANLPDKVPILFMVDACHSGTMLDLHKKIWKGKHAFCLSGCQDSQTSGDTGNGGIMTNALLAVLRDKEVLERRKKNTASIQYIFNKTVTEVDAATGQTGKKEVGQEEEPEEEEYPQEYYQEGFEEDEGDFEDFEGEEEYDDYVEEPQEGQWLNLSWNGGTDPTYIPFPL